jgi:hypothetical protein
MAEKKEDDHFRRQKMIQAMRDRAANEAVVGEDTTVREPRAAGSRPSKRPSKRGAAY